MGTMTWSQWFFPPFYRYLWLSVCITIEDCVKENMIDGGLTCFDLNHPWHNSLMLEVRLSDLSTSSGISHMAQNSWGEASGSKESDVLRSGAMNELQELHLRPTRCQRARYDIVLIHLCNCIQDIQVALISRFGLPAFFAGLGLTKSSGNCHYASEAVKRLLQRVWLCPLPESKGAKLVSVASGICRHP